MKSSPRRISRGRPRRPRPRRPIGARSGGPLLVQAGGWIPRCSRCAREEHIVFQTQAFTGDNTTILVACPAHPDTASIIVLRL